MADGNETHADVRTALYRHFEESGTLLYVGISLSPTYRLAQHRDASAWFPRIANMTVQWFATRQEALDAERLAIKAEKPEFNVVHKHRPTDDVLAEMAEESCSEVTRKVTRFNPSYSVSGAAAVAGVGEINLRLAMLHGEIAYYPSGTGVTISGWSIIAFIEALQAGVLSVRKLERFADGTYAKRPSIEDLLAALDARQRV